MTAAAGAEITAYVALGSNLGDRQEMIRLAIDAIRNSDEITLKRVSGMLENPAMGGPVDSPPYVNAVAEVRTTLHAHALLDRLLDIEKQLGRVRTLHQWDPRLIDLDLILYGDQIIKRVQLIVPHPLMHTREFVLRPLAEIAPDVIHPKLQMTAKEMLDRLANVD